MSKLQTLQPGRCKLDCMLDCMLDCKLDGKLVAASGYCTLDTAG